MKSLGRVIHYWFDNLLIELVLEYIDSREI